MRRRDLLQTAGLTFVGLQLGLLAGCGRGDREELAIEVAGDGALAALQTLAGELTGIAFVGPVCADQTATEQPLSDLLARLRETGESAIGAALASVLAADLGDGRVVDIDGWQLAESECLLLAGAAEVQGLRSAERTKAGELVFEDFAEIERWGPQNTIEGQVFNPVGDGRGAFWVRIAEPVPGSTRLVLDGVELATHFESGVVTASLDDDHTERVVAEPGLHELLMVDTANNRAQRLGYLTVRPKPPMATRADGSESAVFCEIERWGPDQANQGQAFNEQPNGDAAFWVRIGCAPDSAELVLAGQSLPTTIQSGLVTARVPHYAELETGDHPLMIVDPESGEELEVGVFEVL